jgi:extradiol dioxygenase family protein
MTVRLNHTIVQVRDKRESANFFAEVFGLAKPRPFGRFLDVDIANEVTLAFIEIDEAIQVQHYAFLVSEAEFDEIFDRVKARRLDYWADPARRRKGEINRNDGGRGVYFCDPAGHYLEIITRPYGSGGSEA